MQGFGALFACFLAGTVFYNMPNLRPALESMRAFEVWDLAVKAIGGVGTIAAGIAVYWKFHKEKNRQIYEKRLKEVYAPLIQLLIRQETFRAIYVPTTNINDTPIIWVRDTKSKIRYDLTDLQFKVVEESESRGRISRESFIEALSKANYGLARPDLLKLTTEYELLIEIENELRADLEPQVAMDPSVEESKAYALFQKISKSRVGIERKLVKEIVEGYNETVKILGVDENVAGIDIERIREDIIRKEP